MRSASTLLAAIGAEEAGGSLVEFALSCSLQCLLIFGMMQTALAVYSFHFISEAAREASRYASVRGSSCTSFASACPAQDSDVQNYVQTLSYPGITPANLLATTVWSSFPSKTACSPSSTCNNPGDLVTVTVTYSFPYSVPFLPSYLWTATSTSALVISQ